MRLRLLVLLSHGQLVNLVNTIYDLIVALFPPISVSHKSYPLLLRPPHLLAEYSTGGKRTRRSGEGGGEVEAHSDGSGGIYRAAGGAAPLRFYLCKTEGIPILIGGVEGSIYSRWKRGVLKWRSRGAMHTITRNIRGSLGNEMKEEEAAPRHVD